MNRPDSLCMEHLSLAPGSEPMSRGDEYSEYGWIFKEERLGNKVGIRGMYGGKNRERLYTLKLTADRGEGDLRVVRKNMRRILG